MRCTRGIVVKFLALAGLAALATGASHPHGSCFWTCSHGGLARLALRTRFGSLSESRHETPSETGRLATWRPRNFPGPKQKRPSIVIIVIIDCVI